MTCVGRVGGAGEGIFQMDANSGLAAGVGEMLLQSHAPGCHVHLLPALPPAWVEGVVVGLRARGALTVGMRWASGRLTSATISHEPTSPRHPAVLRMEGLRVCCSPRICGEDQAALAAATRVAVNKAGDETAAVWWWTIAMPTAMQAWSVAL